MCGGGSLLCYITFMIHAYTDGSCIGNPGPGGWAYLAELDGEHLRGQGGEPHTTNNRMEMQAVIELLAVLRERGVDKIIVHTDSSLIVNTMTKNWKKKKNVDLWENILELVMGIHVEWKWVKGHAGHPQNEDCDSRALKEAEKQVKIARNMDPMDLKLPDDTLSLF